jgi:isochorismate hydrolase
VVLNTKLLLRACELLNVPVTASEQYPAGLGPTEPSVAESLPASTWRIEKTCFSCFEADGFADHVAAQKRDQVVLAGMEAHICVLQTAVHLKAAGYRVYVVEDAVCSRKLENYQNALERLRQSGIMVTSTESVVFEWLGDSRHAQFKTISQLLR